MRDLYHFTCAHRAPLIGGRGVLKPNPQPMLGGVALVWLTDLAVPDRDGLGLTSSLVRCDRTEFRYRALSHIGVQAWMISSWRARLHSDLLADFELFGQPLRWFVSAQPVPVEAA